MDFQKLRNFRQQKASFIKLLWNFNTVQIASLVIYKLEPSKLFSKIKKLSKEKKLFYKSATNFQIVSLIIYKWGLSKLYFS